MTCGHLGVDDCVCMWMTVCVCVCVHDSLSMYIYLCLHLQHSPLVLCSATLFLSQPCNHQTQLKGGHTDTHTRAHTHTHALRRLHITSHECVLITSAICYKLALKHRHAQPMLDGRFV